MAMFEGNAGHAEQQADPLSFKEVLASVRDAYVWLYSEDESGSGDGAGKRAE